MKINLLPPLTAFGLTLATSVNADQLRITFDATIDAIDGPVPAGIALGSAIRGVVRVDLDTLPRNNIPPNWYQYSFGQPGFTIQFDTGQTTLLYDSVNAASGSGAARGIFVNKEYFSGQDSVSYQLQEADDPSAVILYFADSTPPYELVTGSDFPLSLNDPVITTKQFNYYSDAQGSILGFSASVSSYQMSVIPEPSAPCLMMLAGLIFVPAVFRSNKAAPGNGAMTSRCHAGSHERAVPERQCSAS